MKKNERALAYVESHNPLTDSYDSQAFTTSNKIIVRNLESFDSDEALKVLKMNETILKDSNDESLKNGCIYALAEFNSDLAIKVLADAAPSSKQYGLNYFNHQRAESIELYLDSVGYQEAVALIEVLPKKEYIDLLTERITLDSGLSISDKNGLEVSLSSADSINIATRAAVRYQGNACYRNGVVGMDDGMIDFWHAGMISLPGTLNNIKTYDNAIIHIGGTGQQVNYCNYDYFVQGGKYWPVNEFKGIYKLSGVSADDYEAILSIADYLTTENIGYTFDGMIKLKSSVDDKPNSYYFSPDQISEIRCDGVVEYSYEFNGFRLLGDNNATWDISTKLGAEQHFLNTSYTPRVQSQKLTKVA